METILAFLSSSSGVYVYLSITLLLLAGSFALPFPEDMIFLSAGYLAYKGIINPYVAILVGLLSLVVGDSIIYFLGNKLGHKLLELRFFRHLIGKKNIDRAKKFMDKNGSKSVFISKFIVGLRYSVFFTSGMFSIGYRRFISFDMLASCISVPTLIFLAYYNGHRIDVVMTKVKKVEYQILYVFIFAVVVWAVWSYLKKLKENKLNKKA
jgi:membrane protein DedA with SNARE-associated domain